VKEEVGVGIKENEIKLRAEDKKSYTAHWGSSVEHVGEMPCSSSIYISL
jgi:hypothetical protein